MRSRRPIFDERERNDASPATHGETSFAFLNRVAGSFWQHPRRLLQEWADHLPQDAYADVRARLREDDEQAQSAFLELYLHEALLRAGYKVTVHPDLPETDRHVDFLAEREHERFYVEAVMPRRRPDGGEANRLSRFLDGINKLDDERFFLDLREVQVGANTIGAGDARRALKRWLDSMDPDEIGRTDERPSFSWVKDDWTVVFGAVPKSPGRRQSSRGRAIGIYSHYDAEVIDDAALIRRGAELKAGGYGALDAPLVIAVGVYLFDRDLEDTVAALFGHTAWEIPLSGQPPRGVRIADGFFGTDAAPLHRSTSAVLVVNQLQPSHVHKAQVTLVHHPWSSWPLDATTPFHATELRLEGSELASTTPVSSAAEFFGVAAWADHDPWPRLESS